MPLKSAFEHIWNIAPHYSGAFPSERDYLRAVHHPPGLYIWANSLNLELLSLGYPAVSVTSVWVDHTPQCWFGQKNGAWDKPSCELADLLIVTWEDHRRKAGKALLVQAKKGMSYNHIVVSNKSTKKELSLLGSAPKFLLSSQTSVASGCSPNPLVSKLNCEFQLPSYGGSRLQHCTFLQIKDAKAKRWPTTVPSWQTMWPPSTHLEAYSEAILGMVTRDANAMGKHFILGNISNDWDRLITILINETLASSGGTSKGKTKHTYIFLEARNLGLLGSLNGNFEEEIPVSDDPQGISTVFITLGSPE